MVRNGLVAYFSNRDGGPRTGWRPCDGSADLVRQKKIKRGGGGLVAHRRGGVKGMKITKEKL